MSKLAHVDPPRKILISIPESVISEVHLLLYDPVYKRVGYGKVSKVITNLLRGWLNEQRKHPKDQEVEPTKTIAEHFE